MKETKFSKLWPSMRAVQVISLGSAVWLGSIVAGVAIEKTYDGSWPTALATVLIVVGSIFGGGAVFEGLRRRKLGHVG